MKYLIIILLMSCSSLVQEKEISKLVVENNLDGHWVSKDVFGNTRAKMSFSCYGDFNYNRNHENHEFFEKRLNVTSIENASLKSVSETAIIVESLSKSFYFKINKAPYFDKQDNVWKMRVRDVTYRRLNRGKRTPLKVSDLLDPSKLRNCS